MTVPKWAKRISAVQEGDLIIIRGEGRLRGVASRSEVPVDQDFIREYTESAKSSCDKRTGKKSPHIQFANCRTDRELIDFVRRYGPVSASQVFEVAGNTGALTARQSLPGLQRDHLIFAGAMKLVAAFNADHPEATMCDGLSEISKGARLDGPTSEIYIEKDFEERPWYGGRLWPFASSIAAEKREGGRHPTSLASLGDKKLLKYSRAVVCSLLNCFPPRLVPSEKSMMELPSYNKAGILPVLYYMMRLDCELERIRICARAECGRFFAIERAGQRFCESDCSRLQRQREYWRTHGKKKRKERRSNVRGTETRG